MTEATLAEAEARLAEVTRISRDLDRLQQQVESERDNRDNAQGELARLTQSLAALPTTVDAYEIDLGSAERAVEAWAGSVEVVRDAEDLLIALRQRRTEAEADMDPRVAHLARSSTQDARSAMSNALTRFQDFEAAEAEVASHPADSSKQAELAILDKSLGTLTSEGIEELREEESLVVGAETVAEKPRTGPLPVVALGGGAGLIVGLLPGTFLAPGLTGAVGAVGALLGGLVGLVVSQRSTPSDPAIIKDRELLTKRLVSYGVATINDLQRRWNRRAELRELLADVRHSQSQRAAAETAYERALADLEAATGVRDLQEASEIVIGIEAAREHFQTLEGRERQIRDNLDQARRALDQAQSAARSAVKVLGLTAGDPSEARDDLRRLRAARVTKAELLNRLSEVQRSLDAFDRTVFDRDAYRGALIHAEGQSRSSLYIVGVAPDPATRIANLAAKRERVVRRRDLERDFELQQQSRSALIGNEDSETWRVKADAARSRAMTPSPSDRRTVDDLLAEEEKARIELRNTQNELTRFAAVREERARDVEDVAELDERRAEAVAMQEYLDYVASVFRETSERIDAVGTDYRRAFAPKLGYNVSAWIERATNGRYVSAEVSPNDLAVRLYSRERSGLVSLDAVSQGTRDAVAFLLRTSMVDLLSSNSEPVPIFIDDPLVHVDPQRTQHILEVLAEVSQSRQLFYFTQDARVVDWAVGHEDCVVHRLASAG